MKFDIKKLYKDTVKQLEAHQVEISTALAVIAIVAAREAEPMDEEELHARTELAAMYQESLDVVNRHIKLLNDKLEEGDNAT
jgi:hypothetical protein